jgi:oligopeptide/dipeptide ABC transporter ATP-binding protein
VSAQPLLRVDGLSKTYGAPRRGLAPRRTAEPRHPALLDVSLALSAGDVLGLVGESGSGKSTLARCVSLLERPDHGSVTLGDVELTGLRPRALRSVRRRIQVIFQDPFASLNPRMTVGAAISEVLRVHGVVERRRVPERVAELLSLVGLPAAATVRYPAELSGGQRQRVCIARALAASPDVLIADEAVSSLDVSIQAQVLNLLMDLREELSLTMLFISHDLHVVRRIAPTIAVMFAGRIVEILPPGVPLEDAKHPYTQTLLAALPTMHSPARLVARPDAGTSAALTGCPFRGRCPLAFERCVEDPELRAIAPQHLVACHAAGARTDQEGALDG